MRSELETQRASRYSLHLMELRSGEFLQNLLTLLTQELCRLATEDVDTFRSGGHVSWDLAGGETVARYFPETMDCWGEGSDGKLSLSQEF